jgi:hypothetical protein
MQIKTLSLLGILLISSALFIGLFWQDTPAFDLLQESILLKTAPPAEVTIELTDAQLADLEDAWLHGFDNPEPNDPCARLQMLPFKKLTAWRKQFSKRGFTMDKVRSMLANGRREAFTHPEKGVTFTRIYDQQGNWIVVDFVDCLVWQVAPYNFK